MSSNFFSDAGLIFFVSWSFVLAKLSIAAFGRDLFPSWLKTGSQLEKKLSYAPISSARPESRGSRMSTRP